MTKTLKIGDTWELPKFTIKEFFKKKKDYCVGIPVINEGEKIRKQLKEMKSLSKVADILIFDGGSTDKSLDTKFLKDQKVRTLLTKTSPGKQGTQLRMGCAYAMKQGYKGIIILDGNGKDGVTAIPDFVIALEQGYDYVQGSRFIKCGYHENTPLLRLLGVRLLHAPIMSFGAGKWYTDTTNGYRGLSRKYLLHPGYNPFRDIFVRYEFHFYTTIRANQLGLKTKELPVSRIYPQGAVPTKIHGFKANLDMLMTAIRVTLGYYHQK